MNKYVPYRDYEETPQEKDFPRRHKGFRRIPLASLSHRLRWYRYPFYHGGINGNGDVAIHL